MSSEENEKLQIGSSNESLDEIIRIAYRIERNSLFLSDSALYSNKLELELVFIIIKSKYRSC